MSLWTPTERTPSLPIWTRRTLIDLYTEKDNTPWYWRAAATLSAFFIMIGYFHTLPTSKDFIDNQPASSSFPPPSSRIPPSPFLAKFLQPSPSPSLLSVTASPQLPPSLTQARSFSSILSSCPALLPVFLGFSTCYIIWAFTSILNKRAPPS